jgi:hypothetical protein
MLWLLVGLVLIVVGTLLGTIALGATQPSGTEPGEPPAITSHGVGVGYEGLCLICHGPGGTGELAFPTEGPNDHTGRTVDQCLTCHNAAQ